MSLPAGWYVVVVHRGEHLVEDELLQRVSAGCEAIACFLEEHVMYSAAVGWRDGRRLWSVTYEAERSRRDVAVEGELPAGSSAIRARLEADQVRAGGERAAVDYLFDVPIEIAKSVTGFRHDEDVTSSEAAPFEVLARTSTGKAAERRPWWRSLLGR